MATNKKTTIKSLKKETKDMSKTYSAKTDMISITAHQVRTSLSGLKWMLKMFIDGDLGKLTNEQENLLIKANESNERAINTLSELLIINRAENFIEKKLKMTNFDITELANNCIFEFSGESRAKKIEIILLNPEKESTKIYADKEKIRIVLQNLIENAIKYSNTDEKIFITVNKKKSEMEVSIKDTGIGISKNGKKNIFNKFYRDSKAESKKIIGSGIGLYTIKKIIEDHGGEMWFDSSDGKGTTFYFTIPKQKKVK